MRRPGGGIGGAVWALALAGALACLPGGASAGGLRIRTDFGPENAGRPLRPETRYIILHTTEGRETGSLRKLRKLGEAHYFVHRDGRVTRLLDRRRIATHAGRSMWNGRSELDEVSLGIEVSGYHDREPTRAQLAAVKELVRQLQSLYDIPDDKVLTHSMVAYGTANRFHPYRHRGRKRCAMVFARPAVRERIGLTAAPLDDPDVRAGRLRVGDPELARHLYPDPPPRRAAQPAPRSTPAPPVRRASVETGADTITPDRTAWSIAGRAYASASTVYVLPDGTRIPGDQMRDWDEIPLGTRVLLDQPRGAAATLDHDDARAYVDGLLLVSHPAVAADLLGSAAAAEHDHLSPPLGVGAHWRGAERPRRRPRPAGTPPLGDAGPGGLRQRWPRHLEAEPHPDCRRAVELPLDLLPRAGRQHPHRHRDRCPRRADGHARLLPPVAPGLEQAGGVPPGRVVEGYRAERSRTNRSLNRILPSPPECS